IVMLGAGRVARVLRALGVDVWAVVLTPSSSVELVIAQLPEPSATPVPSTVVPSVSYSVTVAPTSAPLPVTLGVLSLVLSSLFERPEDRRVGRQGVVGRAAAERDVRVD